MKAIHFNFAGTGSVIKKRVPCKAFFGMQLGSRYDAAIGWTSQGQYIYASVTQGESDDDDSIGVESPLMEAQRMALEIQDSGNAKHVVLEDIVPPMLPEPIFCQRGVILNTKATNGLEINVTLYVK